MFLFASTVAVAIYNDHELKTIQQNSATFDAHPIAISPTLVHALQCMHLELGPVPLAIELEDNPAGMNVHAGLKFEAPQSRAVAATWSLAGAAEVTGPI